MDTQTKCCLLTPSGRPSVVPSRLRARWSNPAGGVGVRSPTTRRSPKIQGAVKSIALSKSKGLSRIRHPNRLGLLAVVIDESLEHARNF